MLFTPEVEALKAKMRAVIVRDAEVFFDDPGESEDLQITVRIACEFYLFLQQSNNTPDWKEADYVAETVRSGMDWFFSMAQSGSCLKGLNVRTGFDATLPRTFPELKTSYNSTCSQLLESEHSVKAIGLLLSLIQMTLLFMTVYFPAFSSFSIKDNTD